MSVLRSGVYSAFLSQDNKLYGTGFYPNRLFPSSIKLSSLWTQVACGRYHSLAIQSGGTLWEWGLNTYGQLGDFFGIPYFLQKSISGDTYTSVATNKDNTLFTKSDTSMWSAGNNSYGVLGASTTTAYSSPVQIGSINISTIKVDTKNYSAAIIVK